MCLIKNQVMLLSGTAPLVRTGSAPREVSEVSEQTYSHLIHSHPAWHIPFAEHTVGDPTPPSDEAIVSGSERERMSESGLQENRQMISEVIQSVGQVRGPCTPTSECCMWAPWVCVQSHVPAGRCRCFTTLVQVSLYF